MNQKGLAWLALLFVFGFIEANALSCEPDQIVIESSFFKGGDAGLSEVADESSGCCFFPTDCVFRGKCYAEGKGLNMDSAEGADGFCEKNAWIDCDRDQKACGENCGFKGKAFSVSGESVSHGEFSVNDIANKDKECCGDDLKEFLKCNEKGECFCCNAETSEVNEFGACIGKELAPGPPDQNTETTEPMACKGKQDGVCEETCERKEDPDCYCNKNGTCEEGLENVFNCAEDCLSEEDAEFYYFLGMGAVIFLIALGLTGFFFSRFVEKEAIEEIDKIEEMIEETKRRL